MSADMPTYKELEAENARLRAQSAPALGTPAAPAKVIWSAFIEAISLEINSSKVMDILGTVEELEPIFMAAALAAAPQAPAAPAAPAVDAQALDAAAKKLAEVFDYPWEGMPDEGRENMRQNVRAVFAAAQSAKESP